MSQESYFIKLKMSALLEDYFFTSKTGDVYIDLIMKPSKDSPYGDSHYIAQSLPKELRENGKKGPIVGNAKPASAVFKGKGGKPRQESRPAFDPNEQVPEVDF